MKQTPVVGLPVVLCDCDVMPFCDPAGSGVCWREQRINNKRRPRGFFGGLDTTALGAYWW